MTIQVGDRIPQTQFVKVTEQGPEQIDSESYYRSSEIELEGASAPMSHFLDWKAVPAGKYDLIVTVMGPSGPRAVRRLGFQVLGLNSEP